jgi:peptidoglycan/xylan/chitin deacetylase (PgdA/CDA1 family)
MKSFLSKLNFLLGNKPKILPYSKDIVSKFIPLPYQAVLIISCDFELAWAWRFAKETNCSLERAVEIARRERENIPFILELCEKFNIPLTWAIVGHLFLENCSREKGKAHIALGPINHFENDYWKFDSGEWFDQDPCCDWQEAPEWYAPDLIKKIIGSKVQHEIACHTFSHIDCRKEVCSEEIFRKEIQECRNTASIYGFKLKSFVFPANYIGNRKILKEEGFLSYRTTGNVLGFPRKDEYGLWQIPTTVYIGLSPYNWSLSYYIKKFTTIIERAIKYKRLCHFWFHPSEDEKSLQTILREILGFLRLNEDRIYITTMKGYSEFLESRLK